MFARRIVVVGTGMWVDDGGVRRWGIGCCAAMWMRVAELSRSGAVGRAGVGGVGGRGVGGGVVVVRRSGCGGGRCGGGVCVRAHADGGDGQADVAAVRAVVAEVGSVRRPGAWCWSTVPVGTAARVRVWLGRSDVAVVSNPEFLREGSAVADFLRPDRIVVGSDSPDAAERVAGLYARVGAPTVLTDAASAEMVKYAANCFLAVKLSYVNAVAELCELVGADIAAVTEGMGYDRRIGQAFLQPGPGWGGSCLPKDAAALLRVAESVGCEFSLLQAAVQANAWQRQRVVAKVVAACGGSVAGRRLGVLGLAFTAGTGDVRQSPAVAVARLLVEAGAELVAHDPVVGGDEPLLPEGVQVVEDPYQVAKDAAGLVVLTEWPQYRSLDWEHIAQVMAQPVVVDGRNLLDPDTLRRAGLTWHGIGR